MKRSSVQQDKVAFKTLVPVVTPKTCFNCSTVVLFERMFKINNIKGRKGNKVFICEKCAKTNKKAIALVKQIENERKKK